MTINQKLGRYELEEELGCGGMATVYRAQDTALDRKVAVKVMHPLLVHRKDGLKRFRREAKAVARFKHSNIVEVYDYSDGSDTGGSPYLVCELINGPNLGEFANTHGPPLPELAASMGACLAEALEKAHQNGIVHRDIKPENILVHPEGRLVLTDFGIARLQGDETMTATGEVMGSPAFMSPEQARGETLGPTSDIFSLGVVLYRIATGKLPFSGKNALSTVSSLLKGEYKPPLAVRHDLGPDLDRVIKNCLQPVPEDRYPSMKALTGDLEEMIRAGGVEEHQEELRRYLRFPQNHSLNLQDRVLEATLDRARQEKSPAQALALCDRVLAMDPENEGAQLLLDEFSADRTWKLVALFGVGALLLGAAAFAGITFLLDAPSQKRKAPAPKQMAYPGADASAADALSPPDANPRLTVAQGPVYDASSPTRRRGSGQNHRARTTRATPPRRPESRSSTRSSPPPSRVDAGVPSLVDAAPPPQRAPPRQEPSHGTLTLAITPWCMAKVDGRDVGRSPNLSRKIKLKAGHHRVLCSQGRGRAVFRRTVTIHGGQNLTLRGSVLGKVRVKLKLPPGYKVSIDGVTYSSGQKIIAGGRHRVVLLKAGVPQKTAWLNFPSSGSCTLVHRPGLKCR